MRLTIQSDKVRTGMWGDTIKVLSQVNPEPTKSKVSRHTCTKTEDWENVYYGFHKIQWEQVIQLNNIAVLIYFVKIGGIRVHK